MTTSTAIRRESVDLVEPRITIENTSGSVRISASADGRTHVSVEAGRGGEDVLERTRIEQRHDGLHVLVPQASRFRSRDMHVHVEVPSGARITARVVSADVTAELLLDSLSVSSVSADVTAIGTVRSCSIKSVSGDIDLGQVGGESSLTSTSGDIDVDALSGDCTVKTVSGDLTVAAVGAGSLRVGSVSGDVTVGVARGVGIDVSASTLSGEMTSDIALDGGSAPTDTSQIAVMRLETRTISGDVRIRRQDVTS